MSLIELGMIDSIATRSAGGVLIKLLLDDPTCAYLYEIQRAVRTAALSVPDVSHVEIEVVYDRIWTGPPRNVDRVLTEGDEVAGFRVVHAPGHARGEVIFFRDSDRVAICGDVVRNLSYLTGRSGVLEPPDEMTYDPAENRRSIRKLAALDPSLILPGHGPAITDMAEFTRFVAALSVD